MCYTNHMDQILMYAIAGALAAALRRVIIKKWYIFVLGAILLKVSGVDIGF